MSKKHLPQCGGRLTIKEATDGMNSALDNARRLLNDAKVLLSNERYPSALSLSVLAIEEAGKISIIRHILACPDSELATLWRDYRSHRAKNAAWILPDLARRGARTLNDLKEAANANGEHTDVLNALKQVGFYTDFIGRRNWSKPDAVIDQKLAESIFSVAELLVKSDNISADDNEIWVKHVGQNSPHGLTRTGLSAYYRELKERGMFHEGDIPIDAFIFGDPSISDTNDKT